MGSSFPNFVLITADSLRYDMALKDDFLREISKEGISFERAYSGAPYTPLAISGIMTGKNPIFLKSPLIGPRITISEYLRSRGYITIGIVSNNPFARFYSGNGRGFLFFKEVEEEKPSSPHLLKDLLAALKEAKPERKELRKKAAIMLSQLFTDVLPKRICAKRTISLLLYSLEKILLSEPIKEIFYPKYDVLAFGLAKRLLKIVAEEEKKPFFLWIHAMSTHMPYGIWEAEGWKAYLKWISQKVLVTHALERRDPREKRALEESYLRGVKEFSFLLEDLMEFVKKIGKDRETYFIITADHGEELLEHGNFGHFGPDPYLSEELLRIPLVLYCPQLDMSQERKLGSNLEIFKTILEILERRKESWIGSKLEGLLYGKSLLQEGDGYVVSEAIKGPEELFFNLLTGNLEDIPLEKYPPVVRATSQEGYAEFPGEGEGRLLEIARSRYEEITLRSEKELREREEYELIRRALELRREGI